MSPGRMDGISIRIRDRLLQVVYEGTDTDRETGESYAVTLLTSERDLRALVADIAAANRDMTDDMLTDVLLDRLGQMAKKRGGER